MIIGYDASVKFLCKCC